MRSRYGLVLGIALAFAWGGGEAVSSGLPGARVGPKDSCRRAVLQGEVQAGAWYERKIGGGLKIVLQPIASGWILRVLPVDGGVREPDYAELATPPYHSVTPLSISTDFSFRAQDAIAWNPRRFRFVTEATSYARLLGPFQAMASAGTQPAPEGMRAVASLVSHASEGSFQIMDARLVPGTADQGPMAAAVALHLSSTAHTLAPPSGKESPLGKIQWMRFKIGLDLPASLKSEGSLAFETNPCAAGQVR